MNADDYFQFDETSLELTLNPKGGLLAHTFSVRLVGTLSSRFTNVQHS